MSFPIPILFITYNRPDTTRRVLDEIQKVKPKFLYAANDGFKSVGQEEENVMAVRNMIKNSIDWDCDLQTRFSDHNQGCFDGVRDAINWFFNEVEYGIILEDDIIPSPQFFAFQEKMLKKYKNDTSILSISGFNFGVEKDRPFTTKYMNMWGWGTWRRSANQIDYYLTSWKKANVFQKNLQLIKALKEESRIDTVWFQFWYRKFSELAYLGKPGTWDFQWVYFGLMNNKRVIVPPKSLTINIGFNHESATHTKSANTYLEAIQLPKDPSVIIDKVNFEKENPEYLGILKSQWCVIEGSNYTNAWLFLMKKTLNHYSGKFFIK